MYAPYFGLKREPFSIAPDPRYLFMSERHREALAHLLYGVNGGGGFVLLTGEIGAGKTTVCRCFLEQIPKRCNVAYIFNPKLTVIELLQSVCEEFGIPLPANAASGQATVKDYLDPLNEFLLKTHAVGQNNVLIIDEAQNLSADVLEQLRLLTNLETSERKLLQIILIGQPELRQMLARPGLEQLAQRVIARYHLDALSPAETAQYIRHRLAVAGLKRAVPFDRKAVERIHALSRGVPRRINLLCDRALLGAYAGGQASVDRAIVDKAAAEVFGGSADSPVPPTSRYRQAAVLCTGAVAGAALVGVLAWAMGGRSGSAPAAAVAAASAAAAASSASADTEVTAASAPAVQKAASAAAPAAPAALNLADLKNSLATDESDALRQLAAAWNVELGDGEACAAAERHDLRCFKGNVTLALLRQLGRPGVLTLSGDNGRPMYALLTGLGEQTATLRVGDATHTVSLLSLASVWRGDFTTYWRAPPGYRNQIVQEGAGPVADWLQARLAGLQGGASAAGGSLKSQIAAFQLAQGLKPDGLAGPATFMQLNRAAGVDEPRLHSEP